MALIAFDYRLQSWANNPLQRHAAVLVEFLAMLAVETVLNCSHCGKFFHRPWLRGWTTPKSPWSSDPGSREAAFF